MYVYMRIYARIGKNGQLSKKLSRRMNGMTFYTFMMRNYKSKDSAKGDFANDMYYDKDKFPRNGNGKFNGWHKLIREYLMDCNACDACLEIFEKCWEEYMECEKKRLNRAL